jgi:hypothetical protein
MEYDNRGKVSLWRNSKRQENPNAPAYKGVIVAHRDIREGEELDLALWPNDSDNPRAPQVTGKVSDKRSDEIPL